MPQPEVKRVPACAGRGWQPFDVAPVKGQVEVTVDASGQVFLRGVVTSEEAGPRNRRGRPQRSRRVRVNVQLQVHAAAGRRRKPAAARGRPGRAAASARGDPPPPPEPFIVPEQPSERPQPPPRGGPRQAGRKRTRRA